MLSRQPVRDPNLPRPSVIACGHPYNECARQIRVLQVRVKHPNLLHPSVISRTPSGSTVQSTPSGETGPVLSR